MQGRALPRDSPANDHAAATTTPRGVRAPGTEDTIQLGPLVTPTRTATTSATTSSRTSTALVGQTPDLATEPLVPPRASLALNFDFPPLPDLELPEPALATPALAHTRDRVRHISNLDRRAFAAHHPNLSSSAAASVSPRTRFDLSSSPKAAVSTGSAIPLKPILHNTPKIRPLAPPQEADITDAAHDNHRLTDGEESPPHSPTFGFAPRDDDEPHPERYGTGATEGRTPHPLYTPAPTRRRRRRHRSKSIASARTSRSSRSGRSARSRVKSVWRTLRRKGGKRRRSRSRHGDSSSSSSSSPSSSSTSSTGSSNSSTSGSSSRSSSTWAGWRFWRNSSSGSTSASDSDSDSDWEPPTPHFTLLTPRLSRSAPLAYPSHLFSGSTGPNNPSAPATPSAPAMPQAPVFDLVTTSTLGPALERLQQFWAERRQEDLVSGDMGAGAIGLDSKEQESYFPDAADARGTLGFNGELSGSNTPAITPGVAAGPKDGKRLLRGEERAARATERRLGKGREGEEGPAWWLDVMCPTVADMRELRKLLPLHPLTMEDILHQETREKIESFASLNYYLIVFRALDESYFQYTSPETSTTTPEATESEGDRERQGSQLPGSGSGRRGRVEIVEGVGGKEGVEGVGVGAINLYLVVFPDGILSFHFEDITKHIERVQGKLQQFGRSRNFSSHWIAYGLMDSIVDAFFPLIDFIEGESSEVNAFLADPLNTSQSAITNSAKVALSGLGHVAGRTVYDEQVVGIVVEPANDDEKRKGSSPSISGTGESGQPVKKATVRRRARTAVLKHFPSVWLPAPILRALPSQWITTGNKLFESTMLVDAKGFHLSSLGRKEPEPVQTIEQLAAQASKRVARRVENADGSRGIRIGETKFDRMILLKRLADSRKLVTGLSRLLAPKIDVIKGLRKRTKEENLTLFIGAEGKHDIAIYFGDLFDHIVAMQQSLNFYDAILSHDHPAYTGLLRLALVSAKLGTDHGLAKLYIVTLTMLPIMIITGLFSLNVDAPHNGDRSSHLLADGKSAGFSGFAAVIGGLLFASGCLWTIIWWIFESSKRAHRKRGRPMGLQGFKPY